MEEPMEVDNKTEEEVVQNKEQDEEMAPQPEEAVENAEEPPAEVPQQPPEEREEHLPPTIISQDDLNAVRKEAQAMDVLVCGKCHIAYHTIENFTNHRTMDECSGVSEIFENGKPPKERTAQVWAFLLYKVVRIKEAAASGKNETSVNSWDLYQEWSQLQPSTKETWIAAGRAVLDAHGGESPSTRPVRGKPIAKSVGNSEIQQQQQTILELQKDLEDDDTDIASALGLTKSMKNSKKENHAIHKDDDGTEEFIEMEKIVAKRLNPRTKQSEYLCKWVSLGSNKNTWVPLDNLGNCSNLVTEFEQNLARQKARKALEASRASGGITSSTPRRPVLTLHDFYSKNNTPGSRPVRTSAKKALDQVKEWVGGKRGLTDDDSDDEAIPTKKEASDINILRKKTSTNASRGLILTNNKGVVCVDPKQVPNLSAGVYILSNQSGLIKVDEPTAAKLTQAMKVDGKKLGLGDKSRMVINDTEITRLSTKTGTKIKRDGSLTPGVKLVRSPDKSTPIPTRSLSGSLSKPIILGSNKKLQRVIASPVKVQSPPTSAIRKPQLIKPAPVAIPRLTPKTALITTRKMLKTPSSSDLTEDVSEGKTEDEFDAGLPDAFPKAEDPISPPSPNRPYTLCPETGQVLGKAEGEKTPPPSTDEDIKNDSQDDMEQQEQDGDDSSLLQSSVDDGMVRVEMAPDGTIRQIPSSAIASIQRTSAGQKILQKGNTQTRIIMQTKSNVGSSTQAHIQQQRLAQQKRQQMLQQKQQITQQQMQQQMQQKQLLVQQQKVAAQQRRQRNLLMQQQRRAKLQQTMQLQQQQQQQQQQILIPANIGEDEMISIEGEDGVIYQITPEQQQLLLQNGTLTMEGAAGGDGGVGDANALKSDLDSVTMEEHTELVLDNGQLVERRVLRPAGSADNAGVDASAVDEAHQHQDQTGSETITAETEDGQQLLISSSGLIQAEDGTVYTTSDVLTLDSAVQEAVAATSTTTLVEEHSDPNVTPDKQEESQMVAQIVQAGPPDPDGGPRKVVLLLPDGSLINTEMEEKQYQALDFDK